jgi:cation diffusion facilitator CzcD-associated flavoprotein CzcO
MNKHVDIIIIGAGLLGIGAACHLARNKFLYYLVSFIPLFL